MNDEETIKRLDEANKSLTAINDRLVKINTSLVGAAVLIIMFNMATAMLLK